MDICTKRLYLSNKNLTKIPEYVLKMTNLQRLTLNNNKIIHIPPEIQFLVNLKIIYLSFNKITEVPSEIRFLTNLEELILNDNNITNISLDIVYCKKLTNLDYSCNPIMLYANYILKNIGKLKDVDEKYYCVYKSIRNLMEKTKTMYYKDVDETIGIFNVSINHIIDSIVTEIENINCLYLLDVLDLVLLNMPDDYIEKVCVLLNILNGYSSKIVYDDIKIALKD